MLEEALELVTDEEFLRRPVRDDFLPDHLLLAVGALSLVISSVEVHKVRKIRALMFLVFSMLVLVNDLVMFIRVLVGVRFVFIWLV